MAHGYEPVGPREKKAIHTLLSAKMVAQEVEELRHRLAEPLLPPAEAARCAAEMNDTLSRLCNLISLALAEINESASEQFRLHFDLLLDEVRGRLLQMNFHRLLERLAQIRDQAQEALQDSVYRLGLSDRLELAYADVVDNLIAMGATEDLGLEARFLDEVTGAISTLADIEVRVFKLLDLNGFPSFPPRD